MIKTMYGRVFGVLARKPFRLWGITLLGSFLTSVGFALTGAVPLIAIAISMLMGLGINRVYLLGYRGENIMVENLFDGFREGFGTKLAGTAWTALFRFLWGLIPIVGPIFYIIRGYEYAFVPYILMERPEVGAMEARKVSREETRGWKGLMFGADILMGVLVFVVFLVLSLLCRIPILGVLFIIITIVFGVACIAFLPLAYGLLHAAFYEEITTGRMNAERAAAAPGVPVAPAAPVAPAGAAPTASSVFCPSCGAQVKPDTRFCPSCGGAITPPPAPPEAGETQFPSDM